MTSWRRKLSNQRWNNVVYVFVEIFNVEQRQISVVFFSVDINNVRQCRNNVVIFNVEFHNVDQRQNNVNLTILKRAKKIFLSFEKELTHLINNTCSWLWSIKKKGRYETYNVKINVAEYNAWYMKRIGKYEYAFVHGKINWCTE